MPVTGAPGSKASLEVITPNGRERPPEGEHKLAKQRITIGQLKHQWLGSTAGMSQSGRTHSRVHKRHFGGHNCQPGTHQGWRHADAVGIGQNLDDTLKKGGMEGGRKGNGSILSRQ